jgi:quercetin dioxygenase-like cupin family protein
MNPYKEIIESNVIVRTFSKDVESEELVWHRDKNDRVVEVIQSNGWKFQMDNELPKTLKSGDVVEIPKETFHRVIKGEGNLIIKINE